MKITKTKLNKMLKSADKGMSKTKGDGGVLTRLFRKMLRDLNIGPMQFHALLQKYVQATSGNSASNRKEQTSMRGNLTKELTREQMTWNVFCKGVRFLDYEEVEFIVIGKRKDGRVTTHSIPVDMRIAHEVDESEVQDGQIPDEDYVLALDYLGLDDNHWYIWNPLTQIVYEDVGEQELPPFVSPQTNPNIAAAVKKWQALDNTVIASIGHRISTSAKKFYDGPPPDEQNTTTVDNTN